ncbi:MAG: hypothetical protein Q9M82_01655, partial [Mariprofundus sp.]|nr:hypothetical protein [Mariprofundus sp.]
PEAGHTSAYVNTALSMFGAGKVHSRHRFITRVFRMQGGKTELQIRTLGQQFINHHWANKQPTRKVADELFDAFNEQVAHIKMKSPVAPAGATGKTVSGAEIK